MNNYQANLAQLKLIEDAYRKGDIKKYFKPVEAFAAFITIAFATWLSWLLYSEFVFTTIRFPEKATLTNVIALCFVMLGFFSLLVCCGIALYVGCQSLIEQQRHPSRMAARKQLFSMLDMYEPAGAENKTMLLSVWNEEQYSLFAFHTFIRNERSIIDAEIAAANVTPPKTSFVEFAKP